MRHTPSKSQPQQQPQQQPQTAHHDNAPITDFNGHYQFLNNDHPAWVALDGTLFPSAAIAYQAARTDDPAIRQALSEVDTYQKFKEISLGIQNPPDWISRRHRVMERLLRDKFKRNKELGGKLAATHPRTLINSFREGGDNQQYWGVVDGKGNNTLGKILMSLREEIHKGTDWEQWVADQGLETNEKMRPAVSLIVIREDKPIDKLFLEKKARFFLGSHQGNDFKLDHPSISKFHACLYFAPDLSLMLVDLASSNGTTLLRDGQTFKLDPMKPISLEKNDLVTFGLSSRKYRVEIDCSGVEEYMREERERTEEAIKRIRQRRNSRSRSRSPNHKHSRT